MTCVKPSSSFLRAEAIAVSPTLILEQAVRKSAARSGAKKKPAGDAKAAAIPGRSTCEDRLSPSITPKSFRWPRGLFSVRHYRKKIHHTINNIGSMQGNVK